jgi:hypothetical protein
MKENVWPHTMLQCILGSNGTHHDPCMLDAELLMHLKESNIEDFEGIICVDCTSSCNHIRGIHVILNMKRNITEEKCEATVDLIHTYLISHHETVCSTVLFFDNLSLKQFTLNDIIARFHLRDAIQSKHIVPMFSWTNTESKQADEQINLQCEICYAPATIDTLTFKGFNVNREWAVNIPLVVQILLGGYLNPKTITRKTASGMLPKKMRRLYFTYDILLNTINKQYIGLLQERNTFELLMGYKSVTTVFKITGKSGTTMSLKIAEVKLKE